IASSSTRTASSMEITGRAWNSKAGRVEQNLWTAVGSSQSTSMYPPHSPTRMTNTSILKLAGAFHWRNTSRIRVCAFSYSAGEPCERSTQLIMYFIGRPLFCVGILGHVSGPSVGRCGSHHKGADDEPHPDAMLPFTHSSGSAAGSG